VARHGNPREPQQLAEHRLLRLRQPGVRMKPLVLARDGHQRTVDAPAALVVNHHETVLRATLSGAGISTQAAQLAAPLIAKGSLVRVLDGWTTEPFEIIAALPSRKFLAQRTRAFLDHMVAFAARTAARAAR
jgi:DNA-binding transcriptional LysR family regulator